MTASVTNFIIIDDDSCHNIICALSLKKAFENSTINVTGFTDVLAGIRHLKEQANTANKTVLFLDINMPRISGWDVLSEIEMMPMWVRENLFVYMLSSYISEPNKAKAHSYFYVKGYIEKPLLDHLASISEELANN